MGYNARNDEIRDNVERMRREWEAQRKAEHKQFNLDPKDISELYDVIFVGFPDPHRGQVGAYASAAGRAAIDKVLPNSVIKWRPLERNIKIFRTTGWSSRLLWKMLRPILRTSCRNTCWSFGRWKIAALTNGIFDDGRNQRAGWPRCILVTGRG